MKINDMPCNTILNMHIIPYQYGKTIWEVDSHVAVCPQVLDPRMVFFLDHHTVKVGVLDIVFKHRESQLAHDNTV